MAQSISLQSMSTKGTQFRLPFLAKKSANGDRIALRKSVAPAVPAPIPLLTEQEAKQAAEAQALAAEVRLAQRGDSAAVARLIETNRSWVRGIAYSVLGDAHLAEDAAQEVCVRMCKHIAGLEAPEAFRPWVYRMTRNVALSMAQRRERTPQPIGMDTEPMHEGARVSVDEVPGAALDEDERVGTILDAINRLPDIYREVLVLKHVQELSYAEMSTILNVSIKSLEVRLVRARKMLQDRLGRRFDRGRKRDPGEDKK
jgi:RNA polymerase sigma-70 factor (ECF subfamily)